MERPGHYSCPFLNRPVELAAARIEHIRIAHLEFLEPPEPLIPEVLLQPDRILAKAPDSEDLLFCR